MASLANQESDFPPPQRLCPAVKRLVEERINQQTNNVFLGAQKVAKKTTKKFINEQKDSDTRKISKLESTRKLEKRLPWISRA